MIGWLLSLFPKRWRQRYGDEYLALLEDCGSGLAVVVDVLVHAVRAHLELRRRGLQQLAATAAFVVAELVALARGYGDNVFWLPTSSNSALLFGATIVNLIGAAAPVARKLRDLGARQAARAS